VTSGPTSDPLYVHQAVLRTAQWTTRAESAFPPRQPWRPPTGGLRFRRDHRAGHEWPGPSGPVRVVVEARCGRQAPSDGEDRADSAVRYSRTPRRLPAVGEGDAHGSRAVGVRNQDVVIRTAPLITAVAPQLVERDLPRELASLIARVWQGDVPRAAPPETAARGRSTAPPPGHKAHGPQARPRSHRTSHRRSAPGKACPSTTRGH